MELIVVLKQLQLEYNKSMLRKLIQVINKWIPNENGLKKLISKSFCCNIQFFLSMFTFYLSDRQLCQT